MPISDFDRAHIGEILADEKASHWNWFTCRLLRLIARADDRNRERLRSAYPDEVEAYENWFMPKMEGQ